MYARSPDPEKSGGGGGEIRGASKIARVWNEVEQHVTQFVWRVAFAECLGRPDLHRLLNEWSLESLLAAHRLLDAYEETQRITQPPTHPGARSF